MFILQRDWCKQEYDQQDYTLNQLIVKIMTNYVLLRPIKVWGGGSGKLNFRKAVRLCHTKLCLTLS